MNEHEFVCDLCGTKQLHDPSKGHVPPGWAMRRVNGRILQLCATHANPAHWASGPSPAIQKMYEAKFGDRITEYERY